ncbi:hypothetical protein EJ05DRAFT_499561 [Pseudovirgaria hyperparasitica]|uniref:Ecp2 effector protein domain-containing protein n=1 Tax=Pseudovirgaria hyperparasitica TaxID=470096 RepID=A0A6A6W8Z8_9PEZI|nr:uncharacterized protein EJ05DRAFT_499561 [Pseudovirgaria hyperparasitica]KAF2759133.1 hypothetical protein EJ05DRAFT_499561 [Pseudovirgaria hyperparasitica]
MLFQHSLATLISLFALTSAIPLSEYKAQYTASEIEALQARQDQEYNFWRVDFYTSGCDDEPASGFSGMNDQIFECTGGAEGGFHNAKMTDMAKNGRKVVLYSDLACRNEIGQVLRDGTCVAAASDSVIEGYAIVPF